MECTTCGFPVDVEHPCQCGGIFCTQCVLLHQCESTPQVSGLWPHQEQGRSEFWAAVESGNRWICLTSPTGGGKTRIMSTLIKDSIERKLRSVLYTNRKLILDQSSKVFREHGITHGKLAAGHETAFLRDVQIASIQTIESRVYDTKRWQLFDAGIVFVDEAHAQKGEVAEKILRDHAARGAIICGLTATPIGIGHLYKVLIQAGKNSELRKCGAHLPCQTFGPDEPDMQGLKKNAVGEYSEGDISKRIMVPTIFGRVYDHWKLLNPCALPTILFAPGVQESKWFTDAFQAKGVDAAHIDGECVYVRGKEYPTTQALREEIFENSREGHIKVLCNRFVMREGVDLPWLYHGIGATVFGSRTGFLQAGGRLLRNHESLADVGHVVWQCHGGSWWRHGSLNQDRNWKLTDTEASISKEQKEARQRGDDPEPIRCPKCGAIRASGPACKQCGHEHVRSVRMVVQIDGELKRMTGRVVKVKPQVDDRLKKWNSCLYQAANSRNGMTFRQAIARFRRESGGHDEPFDLPRCPPTTSENIDRSVRSVYPEMVKRKTAH